MWCGNINSVSNPGYYLVITCVGAGIVDSRVITVIIRILLTLQLYHRSWSDVNFFFFVSPTISSIVVYQEKMLNKTKTCFSNKFHLPKQLLSSRCTERQGRQGFMVENVARCSVWPRRAWSDLELVLGSLEEAEEEVIWLWRPLWLTFQCSSLSLDVTAGIMSSHLSLPVCLQHFALQQIDL